MPDKNRPRKGRLNPKEHGGIEERIRTEYRRKRRSGAYHDDEHWLGGGTSAMFMSLARMFEMPIVQIKNIVNFKGKSDRPLPEVTPEILRARQERKGELMAQDIRNRRAWDILWAIWESEH